MNPISAMTSQAAAAGATPAAPRTDPASKEMFMQLLVAQLKNQNPMSPADGMQFVTQLAQFTNLEQTADIRSHVKAIHEGLAAQTTPAGR